MLQLISIGSKESARFVRDTWMNKNPGIAWMENPQEVFPGNFVVIYENGTKLATLTKITGRVELP